MNNRYFINHRLNRHERRNFNNEVKKEAFRYYNLDEPSRNLDLDIDITRTDIEFHWAEYSVFKKEGKFMEYFESKEQLRFSSFKVYFLKQVKVKLFEMLSIEPKKKEDIIVMSSKLHAFDKQKETLNELKTKSRERRLKLFLQSNG